MSSYILLAFLLSLTWLVPREDQRAIGETPTSTDFLDEEPTNPTERALAHGADTELFNGPQSCPQPGPIHSTAYLDGEGPCVYVRGMPMMSHVDPRVGTLYLSLETDDELRR